MLIGGAAGALWVLIVSNLQWKALCGLKRGATPRPDYWSTGSLQFRPAQLGLSYAILRLFTDHALHLTWSAPGDIVVLCMMVGLATATVVVSRICGGV